MSQTFCRHVLFLFPFNAPLYSSILQQHPGGSSIILKYAGKDATAVYAPIHPPDAIDKALGQEKHMGELYTTAAMAGAGEAEKTKDQLRVERAQREKPPLSRILNLKDMEVGAIILVAR